MKRRILISVIVLVSLSYTTISFSEPLDGADNNSTGTDTGNAAADSTASTTPPPAPPGGPPAPGPASITPPPPPPVVNAPSYGRFASTPGSLTPAVQSAAIDNQNPNANAAAGALAAQQIANANRFGIDAMSGKYNTNSLPAILAARQAQANAFNAAVDSARASGQALPAPPTPAAVSAPSSGNSGDLATQSANLPLPLEPNPTSAANSLGAAVAANSNPNGINTFVTSPMAQAQEQLKQLEEQLHPGTPIGGDPTLSAKTPTTNVATPGLTQGDCRPTG